MFVAALIIFNFLIMIYVALGLAVIFHLRKYRWPGDLNPLTTAIFVAGSLIFIGLSFFFFISVPWETITELMPNIFLPNIFF